MTRHDFRTAHRALRRRIKAPAPAVSPWKQPLAQTHHLDAVHAARVSLLALCGAVPTQPTPRQSRIEVLARCQARRNDVRTALNALRAAGADDREIHTARVYMIEYRWSPAEFVARALRMRAAA